jgi:hypothetical protein
MKPKLKPPSTKRLKLKHDEPLSTFTFTFNLRRFSSEIEGEIGMVQVGAHARLMVRRCRLTP